jgi:hypothetical protein
LISARCNKVVIKHYVPNSMPKSKKRPIKGKKGYQNINFNISLRNGHKKRPTSNGSRSPEQT